MKNILIGSRALFVHNKNFKLKNDADWDIITDDADLKFKLNLDKIETSTYDFLNNYEFERYISDDKIIINGVELYPLSIKGLSVIKRSHLYRDYFFDKHITMYHKYLKNYAELDEEDFNILKRREYLTHEYFDKFKHPSLNKSVKDFFDDYVVKKYDHDYLHTLYSYYDKPLYMNMQRDFSRAWCEKDLWDSFSYENKCKCVAEETYVIATERFLVPSNWTDNCKLSYFKALRKVCTTLTSGWFRDFAIDEYPSILDLYDRQKFSYVKSVIGEYE